MIKNNKKWQEVARNLAPLPSDSLDIPALAKIETAKRFPRHRTLPMAQPHPLLWPSRPILTISLSRKKGEREKRTGPLFLQASSYQGSVMSSPSPDLSSCSWNRVTVDRVWGAGGRAFLRAAIKVTFSECCLAGRGPATMECATKDL